jgi:hypothetical protein
MASTSPVGGAFTGAGDWFLNLPQPSARPRRSSSGMTATQAATPVLTETGGLPALGQHRQQPEQTNRYTTDTE